MGVTCPPCALRTISYSNVEESVILVVSVPKSIPTTTGDGDGDGDDDCVELLMVSVFLLFAFCRMCCQLK